MNWAINAYKDWQNVRLSHSYNEAIFNVNLENLKDLDRDSFAEALCYFIPKVTKVKWEGVYPAKTLYQLVIALQKYLNVNRIPWKLIDDPHFEDVKNVLDNVMKQCTESNVGTVKRQAELITFDQENVFVERLIFRQGFPRQTKRYSTLFIRSELGFKSWQ